MQHRCDDLAYGFGRDERMVEIVQAALFLRRNVLRQAESPPEAYCTGSCWRQSVPVVSTSKANKKYPIFPAIPILFSGHKDNLFPVRCSLLSGGKVLDWIILISN